MFAAAEMAEFGLAMREHRFRRDHPDASDDEVRAAMEQWLLDRPLDAPGRPGSWPR